MNTGKLSGRQISGVFSKAMEKGMLLKEDSALIFYDLSFLEERIKLLKSSFPPGTLHALAIKACPLAFIMQLTRGFDFGVEAASIGEARLALYLGFNPRQIVYDSPVKTPEELEFALNEGIHINIDNLSELERVRRIVKAYSSVKASKPLPRFPSGTIGIRINPQVGEGRIAESSVAGEYSKFGVPLNHMRSQLTRAFLENDFLTGLHLHVGSQGCSLQLLVEGAGRLYDLMQEINRLTIEKKGYPQISIFDIGGGLPVAYKDEHPSVTLEDYINVLKSRAPKLFPPDSQSPIPSPQSPTPKLITEFGRWTYTNSGWTVSRVEYVKKDPAVNTAMIHVGADLFVRECLNPRDWQHEYTVLDRNGRIKHGISANPWNLAGPLCFSGDILAKGLVLPEIEEGDFIVIHDTGGYTFSMWSRYNSRYAPKILGYRNDGESFGLIRRRETVEDIVDFWGLGNGD